MMGINYDPEYNFPNDLSLDRFTYYPINMTCRRFSS